MKKNLLLIIGIIVSGNLLNASELAPLLPKSKSLQLQEAINNHDTREVRNLLDLLASSSQNESLGQSLSALKQTAKNAVDHPHRSVGKMAMLVGEGFLGVSTAACGIIGYVMHGRLVDQKLQGWNSCTQNYQTDSIFLCNHAPNLPGFCKSNCTFTRHPFYPEAKACLTSYCGAFPGTKFELDFGAQGISSSLAVLGMFVTGAAMLRLWKHINGSEQREKAQAILNYLELLETKNGVNQQEL